MGSVIIYRLGGIGGFGGDHSQGFRRNRGGDQSVNADPSRGDHSTCWKRFRFGSQHSVVITVSGVEVFPMIITIKYACIL